MSSDEMLMEFASALAMLFVAYVLFLGVGA